MKTSNKLLLGAPALVLALTSGGLLRMGVFVFFEQPDLVHFSTQDAELVERKLPYAGFNSVQLEGFWHVNILRGKTHTVTIEAPREIHERLNASVQGGTLHIRQNYFALHIADPARIKITMPTMSGLRVRGGGEIEFSGFQDSRTTIHASGLNGIKGHACAVEHLVLTGSGVIGIDLAACLVKNADLNLSGLGEVKLRMAGGELRGKVDSAVSVLHSGPLSRKDIIVNTEPRWGKGK